MMLQLASQPQRKRRVLAVGLPLAEFERVAPKLDREWFEVDRFPSALGALELVAACPLEVMLVRYPLPGMDLSAFLQEVRGAKSLSRHSPLVLVTTGEHVEEARRFLGRGANRVVSLEDTPHTILAAVGDLLEVAPRKPSHFIVQLEAKVGKSREWILCRAENTSATGVLLKTDRLLPLGTQVDFEFRLPAVTRPVTGRAEVTRHTLQSRERVEGMGLRFIFFAGNSQQAYLEFLNGAGEPD